MTGIEFITDKSGRKVEVRIDLRKHKLVWEDLQDGLVSDDRGKERSIPFSAVKAGLVKRKRLRG